VLDGGPPRRPSSPISSGFRRAEVVLFDYSGLPLVEFTEGVRCPSARSLAQDLAEPARCASHTTAPEPRVRLTYGPGVHATGEHTMNMSTRIRLPLGVAALLVAGACSDSVDPVTPIPQSQRSLSGNTITVASAAELIAALSPENAGRRILVRAGAYAIDQPLTVPDGATLEGEGVMQFDGTGLPTGFAAGTRTTLSMATNSPGFMLTLGDGVTIRGLEIADVAGRAGNVVAVLSRAPGDRLSASIIECELVNPNAIGGSSVFEGPTGFGLMVLTRNVNRGADPPPHAGAAPTVRMVRSLIRSPAAGGSLFAFNYAPHGTVTVTLEGNVIGGGLGANGGVSNTDAVHDSETRIKSHRNVYRFDGADPCASAQFAWNIAGGGGPPAPLSVPETARNTLTVYSLDDRIEGFPRAILARGGVRQFGLPIAGPSSDNSIELKLLGGTITTPECPNSADIILAAANSASATLFPGDGNRVRALIRGVTGSGLRLNRYGNATVAGGGALPPELQGSNNRVEIIGSPTAFAQTNRQIEPAPAAEFFTGGGH
jgi:hypothetical protein